MVTYSLSQKEIDKLFKRIGKDNAIPSQENIKGAINILCEDDDQIYTFERVVNELERKYQDIVSTIASTTTRLEDEKQKMISLKERLLKYKDWNLLEELIMRYETGNMSDNEKEKLNRNMDLLMENLGIKLGIKQVTDIIKEKRREASHEV